MSKLLIYPHGLGDCLMLTPSLRAYHQQTGDKYNLCIQKRFESSELFKNNPHVGNIHYIKDPWNDYPNAMVGFNEVIKEGGIIGKNNEYNEVIYLPCKSNIHKIIQNSKDLKIKLNDYSMDVFISESDKEQASSVIKKLVGDEPFGFIQTKTGAGVNKDLSDGYGEKWLRENRDLENFIEIGKSFNYDDYNINVQFEILNQSSGVSIPDSVFYHACIALNKDIDFVYFGRGRSVYDRVGNLNDKIKENVKYKL
jgi:hypothetical protein